MDMWIQKYTEVCQNFSVFRFFQDNGFVVESVLWGTAHRSISGVQASSKCCKIPVSLLTDPVIDDKLLEL